MRNKDKTVIMALVLIATLALIFFYLPTVTGEGNVYTQILVEYADGSPPRVVTGNAGTLQIQDTTGREITAVTPALFVNVVYDGDANSMNVEGRAVFHWSWQKVDEVLGAQYIIDFSEAVPSPQSGVDVKVWERRFEVTELENFWDSIVVQSWLDAGKNPARREFVCQIWNLAVTLNFPSGPETATGPSPISASILLEKTVGGAIISVTAYVQQQPLS